MPIYEYELIEGTCSDCPGRFEARQWMKDKSLTECPKCHKPVRRLISRVSIRKVKGTSKLKELGMTRLVRRDKGVYEIEGADSGVLDLSKEAEAMESKLNEPDRYDITPDMTTSDSNESSIGKEAPLKKSSRTKIEVIPFYDLTKNK